MITSVDEEKSFDRIKHPFMIKALKKPGLEGACFDIKALYDKSIANIVLEFLARAIRQEKKIKRKKKPIISSCM
jgi:hypothetical protein